jgi:hypothetical protein
MGAQRNGLQAVAPRANDGQRASGPAEDKAGARGKGAPRPEAKQAVTEEVAVRIWFKEGNPLGFLFVRPRREEYLSRYVLREYARGRSLQEVLDDPYVRNRSTPRERDRLFERPDVVAAIGERNVADLKRALAGVHADRRGPVVRLRPPAA